MRPRSWPSTWWPRSGRTPSASAPPTPCSPDDLDGVKGEITGGDGFDFAFEAIGLPTTIRAAYDAVRRGGTATIVGVGGMDQMVQFNAFEFFFNEKILRGSIYGSTDVRVEFPKLLRLWRAGRLDLEGMITKRGRPRRHQHRLR